MQAGIVADVPLRSTWPQDGPNDQSAWPGAIPPERSTLTEPLVGRQPPLRVRFILVRVAVAPPLFSLTVVVPLTAYDWVPENVNELSPMKVRSADIVPKVSNSCSSPFELIVVVVGVAPNVKSVIPVFVAFGITI